MPASGLHSSDEFDSHRLIEQSIEIARMAGALAHEIKNPLSVIRLNMDLLAEELAQGDSPRDRRALAKVGVVQSQCLRLERLLEDFLKFARAQKLELKPSNLNELVEESLDFLAPRFDEAGIEVTRFLGSDLPSVPMDREKLHAALLNLILNAMQAMPDGGQLCVRTRETSDRVALDLIDTGTGMDDHTMMHLFEPFFSTKPGGSGLGLPTTRRIIEGHHGTITVQSKPQHGTQFTLEFPVPVRITAGDSK